jgi:hypothetical protein
MLTYRYDQDVIRINETGNENDIEFHFHILQELMKHRLLQSVEWVP